MRIKRLPQIFAFTVNIQTATWICWANNFFSLLQFNDGWTSRKSWYEDIKAKVHFYDRQIWAINESVANGEQKFFTNRNYMIWRRIKFLFICFFLSLESLPYLISKIQMDAKWKYPRKKVVITEWKIINCSELKFLSENL